MEGLPETSTRKISYEKYMCIFDRIRDSVRRRAEVCIMDFQ